MGKNEQAIEQYKIYTENFPDDVRGFKNLAILYEREKKYDLAIAEFTKAIAKDNEDLSLKKEIANCYHIQKDYANALKYYDEILAADSKDLQIKTNKAIQYYYIVLLYLLQFLSVIPLSGRICLIQRKYC